MKFEDFLNKTKENYKPLIFIESNLIKLENYINYFNKLCQLAEKHRIKVVNEKTIEKIKSRKYFIIKYGYIPKFERARMLRFRSVISNEFLEFEHENKDI